MTAHKVRLCLGGNSKGEISDWRSLRGQGGHECLLWKKNISDVKKILGETGEWDNLSFRVYCFCTCHIAWLKKDVENGEEG